MQLKGLVRFFTIALIVISLYQLSFTWFVNSHESKMEEKARKAISSLPTPEQKYPGNKDLQALYKDTLDQLYEARLARLLDSTKDQTLTYGIGGAISYQKAKESELNLGLDLQGGMNVTMEVELEGLIRSMANNSKDPNFLKALENATKRKSTSDADYITLFADEYKKAAPGARLASLFANANNKNIKIGSSDEEVLREVRKEATEAVKRTYRVLQTRIDKFGVAQPNVNLDEAKGIITVELAGVNDAERVRKYLQSSANLQFWELYNIQELDNSLSEGEKALAAYLKGGAAATTTTNDSNAVATTTTDTTKAASENLSEMLAGNKGKDTGAAAAKDSAALSMEQQRAEHPLLSMVQFIPPSDQNQDGRPEFSPALGYVAVADTFALRAYLDNPVFLSKFPQNVRFLFGIAEKDKNGKAQNFVPLYAIKTLPGTASARLEGERIIDAGQDFDPITNQVNVNMVMDKAGAKIWAQMTEKNVGRAIAIVLDDLVYSAPNVNEPIPNGSSRISGSYTIEDAQDLANILKAGKLPTPAKIVQEQQVGPTLGQEAIEGGSLAFILSFAVIFILMLVYFNTAGWVANIALILNLLFTVGILSALGATLTAPGIAGLVLTIGMAVDTNVLIFERIKEELGRGKTYQLAVADGYRRSMAPVLDGHITTLLTAIILFYFGLGPVLGFATTQILGILLSLFCGILVSRLITDVWTKKDRHFKYFTKLASNLLKNANYNFTGMRKAAYVVFFVVIGLGIASFFHGFDYGVEFAGGRSYTVRFPQAVKVEQVRDALEQTLTEAPILKTVGGANQLEITTAYMISETGASVDAEVQTKVYEGLKSFLPEGTTYEQFSTVYKQGSKTVLPTISDDLKAGAKWATFWSLVLISIYIVLRFRDWRFAAGTLVALLHDVLVVVIIFSFLKDVVPFPLEVDQHFIAAILTVIGFSMNDTVVVFDRIRENSGLMKGASYSAIINRSINETLSRTIITSLTVFLTILILFLVGGEVTKGFAFAMLIGVFTGVYSSVFVAAPVLLDLGKSKKLDAAANAPAENEAAKA